MIIRLNRLWNDDVRRLGENVAAALDRERGNFSGGADAYEREYWRSVLDRDPLAGIPHALPAHLLVAARQGLEAIWEHRPADLGRLRERVAVVRTTGPAEWRGKWGIWKGRERAIALRPMLRCKVFATSVYLHECGHALDPDCGNRGHDETEWVAERYVQSVGWPADGSIYFDPRVCSCRWCVRHFPGKFASCAGGAVASNGRPTRQSGPVVPGRAA